MMTGTGRDKSRGKGNNSALDFNNAAFEAYNSGQINLQTENTAPNSAGLKQSRDHS